MVDVGDDREVAEVVADARRRDAAVAVEADGGGRAWRGWRRSVRHGTGALCHIALGRRRASRLADMLPPASIGPPMTVAAVILSATVEGALADTLGQPRVRRLVDIAWSGGAVPVVVVSADPDGAVARALIGSEATHGQPAPREAGPVGQMVRGVELASAEVRDTTAVLLWPARMVWVGAETVTSLIEAHGTDRETVLRPGWHGEPGWPVLVPLAALDALRASPRTGCRRTSSRTLAARPDRTIDLGDPGVHSMRTPRPGNCRHTRVRPTRRRAYARMGRRCRRSGGAPRARRGPWPRAVPAGRRQRRRHLTGGHSVAGTASSRARRSIDRHLGRRDGEVGHVTHGASTMLARDASVVAARVSTLRQAQEVGRVAHLGRRRHRIRRLLASDAPTAPTRRSLVHRVQAA